MSQEPELYDDQVEQLEDYLNHKLPDVIREYRRLPKPRTKEEKEAEWRKNLPGVKCPYCHSEYKFKDIDKQYIPSCYIQPTRMQIITYSMNVDIDEVHFIGDDQIHRFTNGFHHTIDLWLRMCNNCGLGSRITHGFYEPHFSDDKPIEKRLRDRIESDIHDLINPYSEYDYW